MGASEGPVRAWSRTRDRRRRGAGAGLSLESAANLGNSGPVTKGILRPEAENGNELAPLAAPLVTGQGAEAWRQSNQILKSNAPIDF